MSCPPTTGGGGRWNRAGTPARVGGGEVVTLSDKERIYIRTQLNKKKRLDAEAAREQAREERRARLAAGARYVCFFGDGNHVGAQYVSRQSGLPIWDRDRAAVHADRDCQTIKQMSGSDVREATDEEILNLTPCQYRGCRIARGEIEVDDLPERLGEPQGDSVRTVSGGQFESNRRKF